MPVLLKLMVIKYENVIKGTYQRPTKFIRQKSNRTRKLKNYL